MELVASSSTQVSLTLAFFTVELTTEGAEKIGELNQRDTYSWKIPEPTKGKR